MNILLFDVETTGLNPRRSHVISNGAILYNTVTGEKSEFYEVVNWNSEIPNFKIPEDTIKVHGITEEIMIQEGIHPLKSFSNFYNFINSFIEKSVQNGGSNKLDACVAFNLPFDLNMYKSNLLYLEKKYCKSLVLDDEDRINIKNLLELFTKDYYKKDDSKPLFIDSLIIDQIFHFEVDGEKVRHDLDSVGNRYGFESDPNAHNAIADTRRTYEVFKLQLQEIEEKGLKLDSTFEERLMKKYNRNQEYYKKKQSLDYFSANMGAVI